MAEPTTPLPKRKAAAEDERSVLLAYLDYHRIVLARKAEGITDEQDGLAACPPSDDRNLAAASMDDISQGEPEPGQHALRRMVVHMIEEYARHCGHAGLLRQAIDGAMRGSSPFTLRQWTRISRNSPPCGPGPTARRPRLSVSS
jgi:hypothetical protein